MPRSSQKKHVNGNSSSIRESSHLNGVLQAMEERKAFEGNNVEMMSIGSNLRLEHLEEQPLRSKKVGSAAKPPKFSHKIIKATNLSNLSGASGADESTSGGGTTDHTHSDS